MLLKLLPFTFLISIQLAYTSGSASANDTVAAIGVGGLVFKKSADIEMLSEELFVSLDQIVVKYRFRNNASDDVTTVVAFPLPGIKYDSNDPEHDYGFSFDMFDGFTTTVDNQVVHARVEEKAMHRGNDETSTLSRYGIPIDPWAAYDAVSSIKGTIKEQLHRLSLIDAHDHPTWSLTRTYYWEQRFPAGREVAVEHRYKPIVGGTVAMGLDVLADPNGQTEFYKKFCVDKQFLSAAKKKAKFEPTAGIWLGWLEQWIEYVLTTGANWSGPIRKFRFVVDKGREENLVSFCGKDVRKIGPTLFEFTATNFVPQKDVFVLVLLPREPGT